MFTVFIFLISFSLQIFAPNYLVQQQKSISEIKKQQIATILNKVKINTQRIYPTTLGEADRTSIPTNQITKSEYNQA